MERVIDLIPNPETLIAIQDTVDQYKEMMFYLEGVIPETASSNLVKLHANWYAEARNKFPDLPSQMITLGLKDWAARRSGYILPGIPYDNKLFSVKDLETISLATVRGRMNIDCVHIRYQESILRPNQGRLLFDQKNVFRFIVGIADDEEMNKRRIDPTNLFERFSDDFIGFVDRAGTALETGLKEIVVKLDTIFSDVHEASPKDDVIEIDRTSAFLLAAIKSLDAQKEKLENQINKISEKINDENNNEDKNSLNLDKIKFKNFLADVKDISGRLDNLLNSLINVKKIYQTREE